MKFEDAFRRIIQDALQNRFRNATELAVRAGISQGSFSDFLRGKRKSMQLETIGKILDTLGASLTSCQGGGDRDVVFVNARIVNTDDASPPVVAEDYLAVPLISEAGAGPGVIPTNELESWFLVSKHEPSMRLRSNLIAVRIAQGSTSMLPTLSPGDVVLVDRNEVTVSQTGKIWLVMDPEGAGKVKRVKLERLRDRQETRLTFYSDNVAENPPEIYTLETDYDADIRRAIVGRVVWAWSDISYK